MKYLKTYENENGITFKDWLKIKVVNSNTTVIDCTEWNLIDLNGIEEFKSLRRIECSNNKLTELPDLNNLKELIYLNFSNNYLTELKNINNLKKLKYLNVSNNKLSELPDLSNLPNLELLYCYGNELPFYCISSYNNLHAYLAYHKEEYPWIWDAKKYNL
jgi:Leucine-rich repeat (LRR) protein